MGQIEKRVQLSDKQYNLLNEAVQSRNTSIQALQTANKHLETVSALVLDALHLPEGLQGQLDEKTHELIYTESDGESEEAQPAKRKSRKADSA